jgi:hypothetical protein
LIKYKVRIYIILVIILTFISSCSENNKSKDISNFYDNILINELTFDNSCFLIKLPSGYKHSTDDWGHLTINYFNQKDSLKYNYGSIVVIICDSPNLFSKNIGDSIIVQIDTLMNHVKSIIWYSWQIKNIYHAEAVLDYYDYFNINNGMKLHLSLSSSCIEDLNILRKSVLSIKAIKR